eukprot:1403306-Pyramimonas_sp.AAC.1
MMTAQLTCQPRGESGQEQHSAMRRARFGLGALLPWGAAAAAAAASPLERWNAFCEQVGPRASRQIASP